MKSDKRRKKRTNEIAQDEHPDSHAREWELSRRQFLASGVLGASMAFSVSACSSTRGQAFERQSPLAGNPMPVTLNVNGEKRELSLDPQVTLLDALRENLGLTGTKKGCDHGQCGACTVIVNGRRINSCLALAVTHDSDEITTIEGIARGEQLHPLQSAFIECDGFQCGYCTPGQICSAVALLHEAETGAASFVTADLTKIGPAELSSAEIRERMSGNICRCGAYPGIVQAVQTAYRKA